MLRILAITVLALALTTCTSLRIGQSAVGRDAFGEGKFAFDLGDYQSALESWLPIAELGKPEAQLGIATIYDLYFEHTVPSMEWESKDALAYSWYLKAAEQGNTEAEWVVATMLDAGSGVEANARQAAFWYRRAAEKGDAEAQYGLGMLYFEGRGVEKDFVQSFQWMRLAAEGDNALAQFQVAGSYECGEGVERDVSLAREWYQRAAAQGDVAAQFRLEKLAGEGLDDFCD